MIKGTRIFYDWWKAIPPFDVIGVNTGFNFHYNFFFAKPHQEK
jgi:hypothetical protein